MFYINDMVMSFCILLFLCTTVFFCIYPCCYMYIWLIYDYSMPSFAYAILYLSFLLLMSRIPPNTCYQKSCYDEHSICFSEVCIQDYSKYTITCFPECLPQFTFVILAMDVKIFLHPC